MTDRDSRYYYIYKTERGGERERGRGRGRGREEGHVMLKLHYIESIRPHVTCVRFGEKLKETTFH
jgi:hypothetical protein